MNKIVGLHFYKESLTHVVIQSDPHGAIILGTGRQSEQKLAVCGWKSLVASEVHDNRWPARIQKKSTYTPLLFAVTEFLISEL